ncbi:MAG TPA: cobalamin-binding protein [Chloroflexota bacterium]|nr:cobalamin-binding protein [Chloroflexota bacterium]
MRIVSLIPSATEIVYALGLDDQLVGVTHECDFPPAARLKPKVTRGLLPDEDLTSREIDTRVAEQMAVSGGIYGLEVELVGELRPDLILTQGLCEVCAVPHGIVRQAVPTLPSKPHVYSLDPASLGDVLANVKTVGDAAGAQAQARAVISSLRDRIDAVTLKTAGVARIPRVFCLEWLDPPWTAGHWVPEMVGMAGGAEILGGIGQPSRRTSWEEIAARGPEVVVLMPCGFDLERTLRETDRTPWPAQWSGLPAVKSGQVYAVDGSAYFNRPGPRLVDGLELLASIIHPELFGPSQLEGALSRLEDPIALSVRS